MHEAVQIAFMVLGLCGLANMVIAPWVHAWKLHRIARRLDQIEISIAEFNDDDPDDGEPIIEESNVVAFGKVA